VAEDIHRFEENDFFYRGKSSLLHHQFWTR
jgi:hypothetical protein